MAYMRDGFVLIRVPGRELIIDEFDEDSIDVEAAEDKATRRSTTRGKNIFSMMRNVPYEITMSIPPLANSMKRTLEFLKFLKSRDYPELEFEIHEVIDGKSVTSYFNDGNIMSELDSDGAFKSDAPTNTLKIAGTRIEKNVG